MTNCNRPKSRIHFIIWIGKWNKNDIHAYLMLCYMRTREEDNKKKNYVLYEWNRVFVCVLWWRMVKESMADGVVNPFYSFPLYAVVCLWSCACVRERHGLLFSNLFPIRVWEMLPMVAFYPIVLWHENLISYAAFLQNALWTSINCDLSYPTSFSSDNNSTDRLQANVSYLWTAVVCMQAKLHKYSIRSDQ